MHFKGAFCTVRSIPADSIQQKRFGNNLRVILHKYFQNGAFRWRQPYFGCAHGCNMRICIEGDIIKGQGRGGSHAGPLAKLHGNSGQQFLHVEGLCDIVHRTVKQ